MRTTLSIDDDVLDTAREMARAQGRSLGEVVSTLARRGLRSSGRIDHRATGPPVFVVSDDVRPLTDEDVARALDEP